MALCKVIHYCFLLKFVGSTPIAQDYPVPSDRGIFGDLFFPLNQQSSRNTDFYDNLSGADDNYESSYTDIDAEAGNEKNEDSQSKSDPPQRDSRGSYIVDDMIIPADLYEGRFELSGLSNEEYRWKDQAIPYQISGDLSSTQKEEFEARVAEFNDLLGGCPIIRPALETDSDFLLVQLTSDERICGRSTVGKIGGAQGLLIGADCFRGRTVAHEIIHAMGFFHEQSRPDRDLYVTVVLDNVLDTYRRNFEKMPNSLTFGVPYDGLSIMHYPDRAFSKNGKPTIISKIPGVPESRFAKGLTPTRSDILKIRAMYQCSQPNPDYDYNNYGEGTVEGSNYYSDDDTKSKNDDQYEYA
ncbi:hypothetical protein TCAL_05538 [Tigriopus californicus]|uniref:Metalloendopeptidase n=1 Tax=Tigriopus californicus TaxID=6832 RepID=A0A553P6W3_TIGCA|nr:seminal metalloprotease 1-like [Tigriopus californicus]TRY73426.1 hypothetical protein TCAL_05538 [Tigriopus californicus]